MKTRLYFFLAGISISSCLFPQIFNPNINYGSVTDVDGNVYKTVQIGSQLWMAENLRTTKFRDGAPIPLVENNASWASLSTPAYCWYNNDLSGYGKIYGALYNWYTVNTGNLCPSGWHVPSDREWESLEKYLITKGYNYDGTVLNNKLAKSMSSISYWSSSPFEGTIGNTDYPDKRNVTGFSALPGGLRYYLDGRFSNNEIQGFFWTSSDDGIKVEYASAWYRTFFYQANMVFRQYFEKTDGFSVRCIKDSTGQTLLDGLVAWYPFNANANDESGNSNDGVVHGASLTEDIFGNPSSAYSFNGVDNHIEIPNNPLINFGKPFSITISFWFNSTGLGTYALLDKGVLDHDIDSIIYGFELISGFPRFSIGGSNNGAGVGYDRAPLSDGTWHFVTGIADAYTNSMRFYVDGEQSGWLIAEGVHEFFLSSTAPLRIGIDRRGWYPYNGKLDEIRIYNRILTEEEIRAMYHEVVPEKPLTNLALHKPATQSSTQFGGAAERAVDGNTDGLWNNGSVTHTANDQNAWWEVDLGGVYNISTIEIWNRSDVCCRARLSDYYVFTGEEAFQSKNLNETLLNPDVSNFYKSGYPDPFDVISVDKMARYIRIQAASATELNIAEVKVMGSLFKPEPVETNVALNKTATQSSTQYGGIASRAVDGVTNGQWINGSITHTNFETNPWWEVDLGSIYYLSSVEIWNRTDNCCKRRLADFYIFASDIPFYSTRLTDVLSQVGVFHIHSFESPDPSKSFQVPWNTRYIRIQSAEDTELNIAEVIVRGVPAQAQEQPVNVAYNKPVTQSSTRYGGVPERAVDGNTNGSWTGGSVTHTWYDRNAWWEVDLGGVYDVSSIELWNRTDACCRSRLTDYYVLSSENQFSSKQLDAALGQPGIMYDHQINYPDPVQIFDTDRSARYVRIQSASYAELNIAEVKVMGSPNQNTFKSASERTVEENEEISGITIYPVPFDELLHIESGETIERIELYNVLGELLMSKDQDNKITTLNTSSLESGYYVLRIKTASGWVKTYPVIKRN